MIRLSWLLPFGLLSCGDGGPTQTPRVPPPADSADGGAQGAALALSPALPPACSGPEIFRIERPVATDDPSLGHFAYGFQFHAPAHGAPVLVFLPGGPGMTSIGQVPGFLPDGWGYLLTDPRGVGCNALAQLPAPAVSGQFFRSGELAADAIAAIADRQLDRYVVFGISYGTLLAARVEAGLEQAHLTAPLAVVMEGVLGRAFHPGEYYATAVAAQWGRLRSTMPADVLTEFDTAASPFGIAPEGWSRALDQILMGGTDIVSLELAALSPSMPPDIRDQALAAAHQYADTPELADPASVELYRQIACRELDDTAPFNDLDPVFEQGQLVRNVAQDGTKCGDLHVTTPFDSAEFQFAAPVYYFVGSVDVATPPWQGADAFDNHLGPAVRVVSQEAGHLSLELDQSTCAPDVLTSIAGGAGDLSFVLGFCPLSVTVDRK